MDSRGLSPASGTQPNVCEAQRGRVGRSSFFLILSSSLTRMSHFSQSSLDQGRFNSWRFPQPLFHPPPTTVGSSVWNLLVLFLCISVLLHVAIGKHGGCMCAACAFAGRFPAVWPVSYSAWTPDLCLCFYPVPPGRTSHSLSVDAGWLLGSPPVSGTTPRQSPSMGAPRSWRFCQETGQVPPLDIVSEC